ncbi:MAG: hypothetical protein AAF986_05980, partial [Pseudomonadota bacterium]
IITQAEVYGTSTGSSSKKRTKRSVAIWRVFHNYSVYRSAAALTGAVGLKMSAFGPFWFQRVGY